MAAEQKPATWPDEIYEAFKKLDIRQVAYVPDAGHTRLINACEADKEMQVISCTTEEEGVAMLAGTWLGGERGALLMQSSGVGNTINLLSISLECRMPLVMVVTMRGEWGEFNPWQLPMGQKAGAVLEEMQVIVYRVEKAEEIGPTTYAAALMAFNTGRPVAVLIAQCVIGFKDWSK
ncbi:MAG TPA: thiamine pyrophosphate-binding protein [Burkholderiales bacterium]|nr:thiamine pyrophosphate-binding protein [Burkholderiales bacterium]